MWLPLKYGFQMICKRSILFLFTHPASQLFSLLFFSFWKLSSEENLVSLLSLGCEVEPWRSIVCVTYCVALLTTAAAAWPLRSCRTSGGLSISELSLESVFDCVCVCVSETEGGLLSCRTIVPHPEFEIRSSSPGGPKSKPSFFTCPLTLLITLVS